MQGLIKEKSLQVRIKKGCQFSNKSELNNILIEKTANLDLSDEIAVKNWFSINKPDFVILAAAKVGGIYANNKYPYNFLFEN